MKTTLLSLVFASSVALFAGCGSNGPSPQGGDGQGALSDAEIDSLLFSREEEKLARDVYLAHQDLGVPFTNIADAEQTHMDTMLVLLDRYGLDDPAEGQSQGEFVDSSLTELYAALMTQAAASPLAALGVGATIEEVDIRDLQSARPLIDHTDILNSYDNLERGSRNHLRAFYDQIVASGGAYTPQYLTPEAFDAIVTTPVETGPGAKHW
jgi:hypothetical protein